jgi:hypothetical protein
MECIICHCRHRLKRVHALHTSASAHKSVVPLALNPSGASLNDQWFTARVVAVRFTFLVVCVHSAVQMATRNAARRRAGPQPQDDLPEASGLGDGGGSEGGGTSAGAYPAETVLYGVDERALVAACAQATSNVADTTPAGAGRDGSCLSSHLHTLYSVSFMCVCVGVCVCVHTGDAGGHGPAVSWMSLRGAELAAEGAGTGAGTGAAADFELPQSLQSWQAHFPTLQMCNCKQKAYCCPFASVCALSVSCGGLQGT